MERCPNCSTPARVGAKFCTTCGFQFDGENDAAPEAAPGPEHPLHHPTSSSGPAEDEDEFGGAWPSAPGLPEEQPSEEDRDPTDAAPNGSNADAQTTDYTGFWPEPASDPWTVPATSGSETAIEDGPAPESTSQTDTSMPAPEPTTTRETINTLLDQLRDVIDSIDIGGSLDLSGVVSDLEVAVTPPGAMPPDDIAELREALFAARERPRDIDTMVDLSKRIDSLVSLVIAHDRAIAAIERSLDTLKRAEQPAESNSPSSVEAEEGLG